MNSSLMFEKISVSKEKFLLFLQFAKNDDTLFLRLLHYTFASKDRVHNKMRYGVA